MEKENELHMINYAPGHEEDSLLFSGYEWIIPGAAVSELQFNIIHEEPFMVHDLKINPLPVWHSGGYQSLGFHLDALRPDRSFSTHFGLPREKTFCFLALEEVWKIQPKRTLFTGMMHLMDHEKVNEVLTKLRETEGLDLWLSYDRLHDSTPKKKSPINKEWSLEARCANVHLEKKLLSLLGHYCSVAKKWDTVVIAVPEL
ncbi:hypothetical protein RJ641_023997, partial [Dillenia turbinata]